ncbi:MAG: molybdenum cofactor guanylyltransferase [Candidatus Zixiibacteriota bacterium]
MKKASAIILAGGKNTRMGRNKAFIQLSSGETILQNTISILKRLFPEIIIVTNQKETYQEFNASVVEDLIKEAGPLGGIFTGLCYSTSRFNFVVACDMPFIQISLIELLLAECGTFDVVLPEVDVEVEPLFALYSKSCIPVMFEQLQKRNLKIREVLSKLQVKKIGREEIDRVDPKHLSFFNINAEEDLRRAKGLKQSQKK